MSKESIKAIALGNGFKLKEQPDGDLELNPYVYEFAEKLREKVLNDFVNYVIDNDLSNQLDAAMYQFLEEDTA